MPTLENKPMEDGESRLLLQLVSEKRALLKRLVGSDPEAAEIERLYSDARLLGAPCGKHPADGLRRSMRRFADALQAIEQHSTRCDVALRDIAIHSDQLRRLDSGPSPDQIATHGGKNGEAQ